MKDKIRKFETEIYINKSYFFEPNLINNKKITIIDEFYQQPKPQQESNYRIAYYYDKEVQKFVYQAQYLFKDQYGNQLWLTAGQLHQDYEPAVQDAKEHAKSKNTEFHLHLFAVNLTPDKNFSIDLNKPFE